MAEDLSGKVGLDTTDFKTGIEQLNRDIRVIESGFRSSSAALGNWGKSADGLQMRIDALNNSMEAQKKKVELLKGEYERIAAAEGEESKAAELMKIRLNDATTVLNKMGSELETTTSGLKEMSNSSKLTDSVIGDLKKDIELAETGFRAASASMKDWDKTADGLKLRISALSSQFNDQELIVNNLKNLYGDVVKEKGELSKEARELQININKETETLNKMGRELAESKTSLDEMGDESKDTGEKVQDLGKKEDETREKTSKLSSVMGGLGGALKAGGTAVAGLAAAVAGVGAAITGLVLKSADAAGELVDMSLQTGFTTTQLQEMAYVGEQVGTSQDVIAKSLAKLTKGMGEAGAGVESYQEIFDKLGVTATNTDGSLRESQVVFGEVIDALGGIENETERDVLALELFGRSAMELNPLIKAGADEITRLTDEAHSVGAVMGEDAVYGLEAFGDQLAGLKMGLQGTLGTLASAFLPAFSGIAGNLQGYLSQFATIVSDSGGDLGEAAGGIGGLLGTMIGDVAAKAPEMLEAGLGILQGIINAIVTQIPVLIPAVVQILSSLVGFLIQNIPILMRAAIEIIMALVNGILPQLPMLITAAIEIIVALANGIAEAIPQLLPVIAEIIPEIIITLIENLPLLIDAALQLIMAIVNGLIVALPILIEYIPEIITAIFDALIVALPMIGDAAVELVLALILGIGGMLPQIGQSAGDIIVTLTEGLMDLWDDILALGENIVKGIWDGISAKAGWLADQVRAFFRNLIQGSKDELEEESPSKVYKEIGENMALGTGIGFVEQFNTVSRQIEGAFRAAVDFHSGAVPALAGVSPSQGMNNGGNVYLTVQASVNNDMDIERLARRLVRTIERRRV